MFEIERIIDKETLYNNACIIKEYTDKFNRSNDFNMLFSSIFTTVENPDMMFLIIRFNDKLVGFIYANSVKMNDYSYLRISEFYSNKSFCGVRLFKELMIRAKEGGFKYIKGAVREDISGPMQKLFSADIEAILLSVEV